MRITRTLAAVTLGLLAAFASVAAVAQTQQIKVAVTSAAENAPFFSAVERGIFSKLGLDVKVDVMPSGVEISNALASNTVDVGLFAAVLAGLLLQRRRLSRTDDSGLGGYVAVLHLTIGSVSRITTLPVAWSTVYVSVSAGSPAPPELMKNAWVGAYAFALSICSSERVGVVGESARPRPALQANVTVVFA